MSCMMNFLQKEGVLFGFCFVLKKWKYVSSNILFSFMLNYSSIMSVMRSHQSSDEFTRFISESSVH